MREEEEAVVMAARRRSWLGPCPSRQAMGEVKMVTAAGEARGAAEGDGAQRRGAWPPLPVLPPRMTSSSVLSRACAKCSTRILRAGAEEQVLVKIEIPEGAYEICTYKIRADLFSGSTHRSNSSLERKHIFAKKQALNELKCREQKSLNFLQT